MPAPAELSSSIVRSYLFAVAAAALLSGCSTTPSSTPSTASSTARTPAPPAAEARARPDQRVETQDRQESDRPERARPRRKSTARLEILEGTGFTIAEEVRIGSDVRSAYESALRLLEQERYAEGIALLVEVTEKAPDVTAPYINLGIAYARSGDLENAEASLTTAVELNPEHPVVHNELGMLYRETGRFAEARESYEKALAIHSGFHFARRNLAILCDLYLNDLPCALEHYEAYNLAVPEDQDVAIWIADIRNRVSQAL